MKDRIEDSIKKEYFISFVDYANLCKIRALKSSDIGTLIKISGQVVRTHPVHPELVSGTFTCLNCKTVIFNVEQQFRVRFLHEYNYRNTVQISRTEIKLFF